MVLGWPGVEQGKSGEIPALTRNGDRYGGEPECLRGAVRLHPFDSPPRYAEEGLPMIITRSRRALVALSATALSGALSGMLVSPAAAHADTSTTAGGVAPAASASDRAAAQHAAAWLGWQFVEKSHLQTEFDGTAYDDAGLTLDAVLAFAAAKSNAARSGAALNWLSDSTRLAGYIGDGTTESYAGAHAKLALALQVSGRNAASFGGRNVVSELAGLQASSGRLSDTSQWGDYSNAFGQSLGTIALVRAGQAKPANRAATYLAGQACADGGVPIAFEQSICTSDADATALAVQAFAATGRDAAAAKAATWLRGKALPAVNTNTAGLASAALVVAGRPNLATAAGLRTFVRGKQQTCAAPAGRRGAIAYAAGPFDRSTAVRATTQAILGLTSANLATLSASGSTPGAPALTC